MPLPLWVTLISAGSLALVFAVIGAFFRWRPRFKPFVRTVGVVGPSSDSGLGDVVHFVDQAGHDREAWLISWSRLPDRGTHIRIVYDTRNPGLVSIEGPVTDGTVLFVLAGTTLLVGWVIGVLAVVTGTR